MKDFQFKSETPRQQIYVSIDIETDGPIPGEYSMLSCGAVAITAHGEELGEFYEKIKPLPEAQQHPKTMAWWALYPEAWEEATCNARDADEVMNEFAVWLRGLKRQGEVQFVAYPAGFDFTFVHWYLVKFVGANPLSFVCIDMKTYAMSLLGLPFKSITKKRMPQIWKRNLPKHTHNALDDAREQAMLFSRMLAHRGATT